MLTAFDPNNQDVLNTLKALNNGAGVPGTLKFFNGNKEESADVKVALQPYPGNLSLVLEKKLGPIKPGLHHFTLRVPSLGRAEIFRFEANAAEPPPKPPREPKIIKIRPPKKRRGKKPRGPKVIIITQGGQAVP